MDPNQTKLALTAIAVVAFVAAGFLAKTGPDAAQALIALGGAIVGAVWVRRPGD